MTADARMLLDPDGALLDSARECEAEVFLRWYGNTRAELEEEYGPYEDASVFLAIADRDDEVVAAARLIAPGGRAGLKALNDVQQAPWQVDGQRSAAAVDIDLSTTWEIATLGVRRQAAEGTLRLSLALYHGIFAVSRANAMSSFVAILDERVRRMLGSAGILTRALPGTTTAPYLGSEASTPVYAHCAALVDHQRRTFPDAYRLVTLGQGLEGLVVPPVEEFRYPRGAAPAARHHEPDLVPLGASSLVGGP